MEVQRPVFIIGIGRSGSTIFFDILSSHPELVWLSHRLCNRFPGRPEFNRRLMRFINVPVAGKVLRDWFEPGECYPYWNSLYKGFGRSYRDLCAHDVSARARARIRSSLGKMLPGPDRRLVIKITGWNRIDFLREIFPDAQFVHVKRDPRAVINSFLNVFFWPGWKGPHHLFMRDLTDEQKRELERFDYSFVALAGMQVEAWTRAYEDAKKGLSADQLFEVSYESLCEKPLQVYRETCDFCDLKWNAKLEAAVLAGGIRNTNYKWKQDLSIQQQEIAQYYYDRIVRGQ